MRLREEFALPDATPPPLQIIAGAEPLPLMIMIADLTAHLADVGKLAKIEAAPPDEWLDAFEEIFAQRLVTCCCTRADEGSLLPCQRARLIIADRRFDRDGNRRHLGRGSQPHVDAEDITIFVTRGEKFDYATPNADRAIGHILAFAVRQYFGVIEEDGIDIGRIVEFLAAMLAKAYHRKSLHGCVGHALGKGSRNCSIKRAVSEIGKDARNARQVPNASQIGNRCNQCHCLSLLAQRSGWIIFAFNRQRLRQSSVEIPGFDYRYQIRLPLNQLAQKRAVCLSTRKGSSNFSHFRR